MPMVWPAPQQQQHHAFAPPPLPEEGQTTLFVGGLDAVVSEAELFTAFDAFGPISGLKIVHGKGCGFVQVRGDIASKFPCIVHDGRFAACVLPHSFSTLYTLSVRSHHWQAFSWDLRAYEFR